MNMRSVLSFVLLVTAYVHCSKFSTVSRRIDGGVSAVSDSHIYVVRRDEDSNGWLAVYRNTESCIDLTTWTKILPPDSQPHDHFGTQVAYNRKFVAISAKDYNINRGSGIVYIYSIEEHQFTFIQKLLPDEPREHFGRCLAINENNDLVIGSAYDPSIYYIFSYNNSKWTQVQIITSVFDDNVDINANDIVIGGKFVSIYTRDKRAWKLKQTLHPRTSPESLVVTMDKNCLMVGDFNASKVYVYRVMDHDPRDPVKDAWVLTNTINGSAQSFNGTDDFFGHPVDLYGNVMVVGASNFVFNATLREAGIVYIFQFDTKRHVWEEKVRLTRIDVSYDERPGFGQKVTIGRNFVFVNGKEDYLTYVYEYGTTTKNSGRATHGFTRDIFALLFFPCVYYYIYYIS